MSYDIDTEPVIIRVPSSVALPPGNITGPEWTTVLTRVSDLEGRDFDDFGGIDLSAASDGDALLYDEGTGTVVPGTVSGAIERVDGGSSSSARYDVGWLRMQNGLIVEPHPTVPAVTIVRPNYGTDANTIAFGNHQHNRPSMSSAPISPGGYMSSGTRQLGSLNITLPTDRNVLVEAWITMQMRGGAPGPCRYRFNLTIAGNTRTSGTGDNGFWCVQGVPDKTGWEHHQYINGNGSTITVSASVSYDGAGGFYTDAGTLWARVSFSR